MHNQSYKSHNTYNYFLHWNVPRDVTVLQMHSLASFFLIFLDIFYLYERYLIRCLLMVFQNVNLVHLSLQRTEGLKDTFESMELFHQVLLASLEAPQGELRGRSHPRHVKALPKSESTLESYCRGTTLRRLHKLHQNQMTASSAILE